MMDQINLNHSNKGFLHIPKHLGIIMDGNGRWAQSRGLPRSAGHKAGAQKVHEVVEYCGVLKIRVVTLYAFSTENWRRPSEEVDQLMDLAEKYAESELEEMHRNGVCIQLMGRREGLPASFLEVLDQAAVQTKNNTELTLNIAMNYGGRAEIVDAARSILSSCQNVGQINESIFEQYLYCPGCPDIDLLIRTGGEMRLSNFMIWRMIKAIFWCTPVYWPDFQRENLEAAIHTYSDQMSASDACM